MKNIAQISRSVGCIVLAFSAWESSAAVGGATRAEAEAMVKKGVAYIRSQGAEKAYQEFNKKGGAFSDRDLYLVVYTMEGAVRAHGGNAKMIGKDLMNLKDMDGKAFVRERVELAAKNPSFWQDYKFVNPETQKIEPKSMYCEREKDLVVCGGVYN